MSSNESVESVAVTEVEETGREPSNARRNLLTALLGAAGLGVAALSAGAARPRIGPDPTPPSPHAPNTQGATGTDVAWVSWIGTSPNATDLNLRALGPGAGNTPPPRVVVALGFWSPGDGGGGVFEWESGSGTDNGGTAIVPGASAPTYNPIMPAIPANVATGAGYWRRIYSGALDIRWFGCKCDGTDDTGAFANALAALPPGGQLVISGKVTVGTPGWNGFVVQDKAGFSLVGFGASSGLAVAVAPGTALGRGGIATDYFYSGGSAPGQALVLFDCQGAEVRQLLFDAQGTASGLLGLSSTNGCLLADCNFQNVASTSTPALTSYAGKGNIYRGNQITQCSNGAVIGAPAVAQDETLSLVELGAVFTENYFFACSGDAPFQVTAQDSAFTSNVITSCTQGILFVAAADDHLGELTLHLGSFDLVVSSNVVFGNSGSAIVAVGPPGTHHDWLLAGNVMEGNGGAAVQLGQGVNDVTITGNLIRDNTAGIQISSSHNVTISSNQIVDDRPTPIQGPAILLDTVQQVVISGNVVTGVGVGDGTAQFGYALWLNTVTDAAVTGNLVRNVITNGQGIYLAATARVNVTGNQVSYCTQGIAVSQCDNTTVGGNVVSNCSFVGIAVGSPTTYLSGNQLLSNQTDLAADWVSPGVLAYSTGDAFLSATPVSPLSPPVVSVDSNVAGVQQRGRGAGQPSVGSWQVGDLVYSSAPAVGAPVGWVCTAAGAPGTWHPFGAITT